MQIDEPSSFSSYNHCPLPLSSLPHRRLLTTPHAETRNFRHQRPSHRVPPPLPVVRSRGRVAQHDVFRLHVEVHDAHVVDVAKPPTRLRHETTVGTKRRRKAEDPRCRRTHQLFVGPCSSLDSQASWLHTPQEQQHHRSSTCIAVQSFNTSYCSCPSHDMMSKPKTE